MIPVLTVPILTRPELLQRFMSGIDFPVAELLIIDNGVGLKRGDLETWRTPYVQRMHLLSMPSNLGVPASWNMSFKCFPFAPWHVISNFDVTLPPGALEQMHDASSGDRLTLSCASPPWCFFSLGAEVVMRAGLFDEFIFPAYWEDSEAEYRYQQLGIEIRRSSVYVEHDNSSSLTPDNAQKNVHTFQANGDYVAQKMMRGDLSQGHWSLARRRANSWD